MTKASYRHGSVCGIPVRFRRASPSAGSRRSIASVRKESRRRTRRRLRGRGHHQRARRQMRRAPPISSISLSATFAPQQLEVRMIFRVASRMPTTPDLARGLASPRFVQGLQNPCRPASDVGPAVACSTKRAQLRLCGRLQSISLCARVARTLAIDNHRSVSTPRKPGRGPPEMLLGHMTKAPPPFSGGRTIDQNDYNFGARVSPKTRERVESPCNGE